MPNVIKMTEMDRACSTYAEAERGAYRVLAGKAEGRSHLEDPGVNGKLILKWIFEVWDGGMYWIDLAQDRGR